LFLPRTEPAPDISTRIQVGLRSFKAPAKRPFERQGRPPGDLLFADRTPCSFDSTCLPTDTFENLSPDVESGLILLCYAATGVLHMSSQCDGDDRELATRKACFSFELDSAVFRIGPPFIRLGPLSMNRVPKWAGGQSSCESHTF